MTRSSTSVRLDDELRRKLAAAANAEDTTVTEARIALNDQALIDAERTAAERERLMA